MNNESVETIEIVTVIRKSYTHYELFKFIDLHIFYNKKTQIKLKSQCFKFKLIFQQDCDIPHHALPIR